MAHKIIIIGAGGAGLEALFVARRDLRSRWEVVGFADDSAHLKGTILDGVPVLGGIADVFSLKAERSIGFHCAIGKNDIRRGVAQQIEALGFEPATLIDPSSVVAGSAAIGAGTYIGPLTFVGPDARIGRHVLVNTQVSVGHHAKIADFSQLCPGSRISGHCSIGEGGFVASNAVIAPGAGLGAWATLGAASFALKDVAADTTALGNPARVILR